MRAVNLIPERPAQRRLGRRGPLRRRRLRRARGARAGSRSSPCSTAKPTAQVSAAKSKAATLTREAQQAQAEPRSSRPTPSFISLREQREQAVAALVDTRFDWAHAIHEFGRVLRNRVSISSLDGTVGGTPARAAAAPAAATPGHPPPRRAAASSASVTSATPSGSVPTFTIQGCATSQREVADTMQRLRLIDGVSEVTLQSSTKGTRRGRSGCGRRGGCGRATPSSR